MLPMSLNFGYSACSQFPGNTVVSSSQAGSLRPVSHGIVSACACCAPMRDVSTLREPSFVGGHGGTVQPYSAVGAVRSTGSYPPYGLRPWSAGTRECVGGPGEGSPIQQGERNYNGAQSSSHYCDSLHPTSILFPNFEGHSGHPYLNSTAGVTAYYHEYCKPGRNGVLPQAFDQFLDSPTSEETVEPGERRPSIDDRVGPKGPIQETTIKEPGKAAKDEEDTGASTHTEHI